MKLCMSYQCRRRAEVRELCRPHYLAWYEAGVFEPRQYVPRVEMLEAYAYQSQRGGYPEQIARRMGVTPAALARARQRGA